MQRPTSFAVGTQAAAGQSQQSGSHAPGAVSQDFAELIAAKMDFSRHFSDDLKRVLFAAYREVQGRRDPCVGRHNLLLALLQEPRIRAHVVLAERDIDKLSSLIHDQLQVINPKAHRGDRPGDALAQGPALGGDRSLANHGERWDDDLIRLLSYANRLFAYHGLPNIDVNLVFDLLRYDTDLRGLFSFSASGNADHHDERIDQIHVLYEETQRGTDLLASKLQTLESRIETLNAGVTRLTGETDRHKGEIADVASKTMGSAKQSSELASRIAQLDSKVTGITLEMSKLQGTLQTVLGLLDRVTRIQSPYGYDPRYPATGIGAYPVEPPRAAAPTGGLPGYGAPPPPASPQPGAAYPGPGQPAPYPQDPRLRTEPYQPAPANPAGADAKRSFLGGLFGKAKDETRQAQPPSATPAPQSAAAYPDPSTPYSPPPQAMAALPVPHQVQPPAPQPSAASGLPRLTTVEGPGAAPQAAQTAKPNGVHPATPAQSAPTEVARPVVPPAPTNRPAAPPKT